MTPRDFARNRLIVVRIGHWGNIIHLLGPTKTFEELVTSLRRYFNFNFPTIVGPILPSHYQIRLTKTPYGSSCFYTGSLLLWVMSFPMASSMPNSTSPLNQDPQQTDQIVPDSKIPTTTSLLFGFLVSFLGLFVVSNAVRLLTLQENNYG